MHAASRAAPAAGGDPTGDPSSPYFIDADHPYATAAASTLTSHRSRSKWSHLSSLPVPDSLPASAVAAVPLLLRRRPHVALSFYLFATRRLLPTRSPPPLVLSASAAHVAAASRLRRAALSVLSSAARHYSHSQIFRALAATYRRFSSAPFVFDLLLLAYLRSRRDNIAAASIARRILAAGARPLPSTSAALLRSLSADAALDMYHDIYTHPSSRTNSQLLPTVQTFNSLLLTFYREGRCRDFKIVLEEMDKYSCRHNVSTYNIQIAAHFDDKEVEKAQGLWDEMVQGGIQPDVATYNTMISGYCGAGEVGMAEEMFKDMEMGGINPSATTFEWLVRGHCRVGDIDAVMLVRSDMRRRGFQMAAEVVEEVVDVLCQNKRVKEALNVLKEETRSEEFVPSQGCYKVLIKGFCEQGEVEVAMKLQAEMAGKGFKAGREVYHAFVCAYEKVEDYEMAERLRKEMSVISIEDE
ncbi:hypothetical protein GUJ93_ZPchr0012g20202 [Zizania palustris]|uniref:Pentacotripeptide-repeat region of PRORP domain-containing protein n=1 Tax=Zizania palustris TaxID=103762 RepID=A0A8J5WNV2_ZIZPA|nr:hypothetical protein GUJ93_ZPchr0012g20202 [Zizania palustris]